MKLSKTGKKAVAIVVGGAIVIVGAFSVPILFKNEVKRFEAAQAATPESAATAETAISTGESAEPEGIVVCRGEAYKKLNLEDFTGKYVGINASDSVELPEDYKSITLPADYVKDVDEEVESDLAYIKNTYGELVDPDPADAGIKEGYAVAFKYKATVDGNTFFLSDGTETNATVNDYTVGETVIFDGLDDMILGHRVGDTIDTTFVVANNCYGEDGNELSVCGKEANITIKILNVKVPVLTDAVIENTFFGYFDEYGIDGTVKTIEDATKYYKDKHLDEKEKSYAISYLLENSVIKQEAIDDVVSRMNDFYSEFVNITADGEGYDNPDDYAVNAGYQSKQDMLDSEAEYIEEQAKEDLIWQAISEQNDLASDNMITDYTVAYMFGFDSNEFESLKNNFGYKEEESVLAAQDAEAITEKRAAELYGWNLSYGYHVTVNDKALEFIVSGMSVGE